MSDLEALESALLAYKYAALDLDSYQRKGIPMGGRPARERREQEVETAHQAIRDLFKQQQESYAQRGELLEAANIALENWQRRCEQRIPVAEVREIQVKTVETIWAVSSLGPIYKEDIEEACDAILKERGYE